MDCFYKASSFCQINLQKSIKGINPGHHNMEY